MEGYVGQVCRSRSWGQKCSLGRFIDFRGPNGPAKEETGGNTTWGVFKAYAFFIHILSVGGSDKVQRGSTRSFRDAKIKVAVSVDKQSTLIRIYINKYNSIRR